MINFLLYIASDTYRDYAKAICFLSIFLVITTEAIAKFITLKLRPEIYLPLKPYFQLSVFLFIPLFILLVLIKFKKSSLFQGELSHFKLPRWINITITIALHILLLLLLAYNMVVE
jgi:hypothetical protein